MTTTVIHIKDSKPDDVYIGRHMHSQAWTWGNPFRLKDESMRAQVIADFETWLTDSTDARAVWMRAHIHELKGKRLACYCAPRACHGDVLARLAEAS